MPTRSIFVQRFRQAFRFFTIIIIVQETDRIKSALCPCEHNAVKIVDNIYKEIVNYNETNKSYLIELFKIKKQINIFRVFY